MVVLGAGGASTANLSLSAGSYCQSTYERPHWFPIGVGLTGFAIDSGTATLAMPMSCPNISIAARQIMQLSHRCKGQCTLHGHSTHCAIAAYRAATVFPLLMPLFPARFAQFFRMFAGFFDADEMLHPAIESLEPMPAAIVRSARAASAPRFDVQRPLRAVCLFSHERRYSFGDPPRAKNPDVTP